MIYFYIVPMYEVPIRKITQRDSPHVLALPDDFTDTSYFKAPAPTAYRRQETRAHIKDDIVATPTWCSPAAAPNAKGWLRLRAGSGERVVHIRDIHASDRAVNPKLRQQKLRGVTFSALEEVVKRDEKQRYHLLYEPHQPESPAASSQSSSWWIRANQGHSLKVRLFHVRYLSLLLRRTWK